MWSIVSSLQFISFLSLIKLNYPGNLMLFLGYLDEVNNYNSLIPNIFDFLLNKGNLTMVPYNSQFEARGIGNRNMLLLVGSDLQIMGVTLLFLFILEIFIMHNKDAYANGEGSKLALRLRRRFKYSGLLRMLVQAYMKICIAAFVNIGAVIYLN